MSRCDQAIGRIPAISLENFARNDLTSDSNSREQCKEDDQKELVDDNKTTVFPYHSNDRSDTNQDYRSWYDNHTVKNVMFDVLITEKDILIDEGINSNACEC